MRDRIGKMSHDMFSVQDRDNILTAITYFDDMYDTIHDLVQIMDGVDIMSIDEYNHDKKEVGVDLFKHRSSYDRATRLLKELRERVYHNGK